MRKLLSTFVFVLVVLFGMQSASAQQNYQTGVGLRFGPNYGLTVKHFLKSPWAIEGILSSRSYGYGNYGRHFGWNLTGLAEWHGAIPNAKGFAWYAGLGAHIGRWYGGYWRNNGWNGDRYYTVFGLDGVLGIEYTFAKAPFTLALDWKPQFDLAGDGYFWYDGVALSVRINLGK